ncbi:HlyD family secretion protein [Magnetospirillum sp. SS-4]|uniref:HlyD family secretion protein n=1 Tax=Magnetospirillum sp. SS-4 TaxID=2681465 RepID=UPI00138505C8|nr:HlyD family efflux transporter periplasmic adaptor subunit [Magnetospirillum sp. SS-4]CAA7621921.1 conserved hypothetical protein [Magnetospirillum sp. SS-4]
MTINFGRMARGLAGGGMLSLGAWLVVPPLLNTISIDAVVNARIVVLRSPIEGKVEQGVAPVGAEVMAGQKMVTILNDRQDASFSGELKTERESLTRRISALDEQSAALNAMLADLDARASAYRNSTRIRASGRLNEAEAGLKGVQAQAEEAASRVRRHRMLAEKGFIATARVEESEAAHRLAAAEVDRHKSEVARMRDELRSIDGNVFLGDGQNDVPYSRQRMDEVRLRLQEIAARRDEYATRVEAIDRQITVETDRLRYQASFTQPSPISGVVWRSFVTPGTDVVIGTELMEVLDCSNLFLDVSLAERHFDSIRPGNVAEVRLIGSDDVVEGVVKSVRGAASVTDDRHLAARLPGRKDRELQVIITLPKTVGTNAANFCQVGRSAKVVFQSRQADKPQEVAHVTH